MMNTTKKKLWLFLCLLACVAVITLLVSQYAFSPYHVKTIALEDGWGYSISYKRKALIRQEYLPAVQGNIRMENRWQARKLGKLVKEKLEEGQSPAVTLEELQTLGLLPEKDK